MNYEVITSHYFNTSTRHPLRSRADLEKHVIEPDHQTLETSFEAQLLQLAFRSSKFITSWPFASLADSTPKKQSAFECLRDEGCAPSSNKPLAFLFLFLNLIQSLRVASAGKV